MAATTVQIAARKALCNSETEQSSIASVRCSRNGRPSRSVARAIKFLFVPDRLAQNTQESAPLVDQTNDKPFEFISLMDQWKWLASRWKILRTATVSLLVRSSSMVPHVIDYMDLMPSHLRGFRPASVATVLQKGATGSCAARQLYKAALMGSRLQDIRTYSVGRASNGQGEAFVRGLSPAMLTLESVIGDIARTNIPVLVVGESGSGKQMFAQRIHLLSLRAEEEMAKVACASMKIEEFSAELESHGSRAVGTVLFDEVSELDSACQRYLLHSLPDGDEHPRPKTLTARVISTTSRNLDEEMCAGRFRSELFYRMNGVCLRLPPLRERRKDIPLLAEFFMVKHATLFGRPRRALSSRTLQIFLEYNWPGNVRQLENVVKNIVALGDEDLSVAELAAGPSEKRRANSVPRSDSLKAAAKAASREAERELILRALERTRWNRKRAARELQISYKSLLYKLKQIGLQDAEAN